MRIELIGTGLKEQPAANIVGAKAANLARVAALGLPVPPAFVLPIALCEAIVNGEPAARQELAGALGEGIAFLENATGRRFGDRRLPLLVSVRSGAARSMPGMLDTVLDVGCTPAAVHGLIRMTGNPRFAFDCRRRFLESFGSVVLGIPRAAFKSRVDDIVAAEAATNEAALDSEALERVAAAHQRAIEDHCGTPAETAMEQLQAAAEGVYRSWMSERAVTYRRLQRFDDLRGTAVTVQTMVFGNNGSSSGAGVAFSRNPSTGAKMPVIDIMFRSQGEDVVSGQYTPDGEGAIERVMPEVAGQLRDALDRLECAFGDVQDVEFTIEDGKLWILQTRAVKRSPQAALRFAIDFVNAGRISPAEALLRLNGVDLETLMRRRLDDVDQPAGSGIGASAGIAVGRAAFDTANAERMADAGNQVILIRPDTSTADVAGFAVSAGIVTAAGGRTAHAALVARQMDKPCVVGCTTLAVDTDERCAKLGSASLREGDWLSIDGEAGTIYLGRGTVVSQRPEAELAEVTRWRNATTAAVA